MTNPEKTGFKLLTLHKPSILKLLPFGRRAYVLNNHIKDSALEARAELGIMVSKNSHTVGAYWM